MTDFSKKLDQDAWMRRVGQRFDFDNQEAAAIAAFIDLPVPLLRASISIEQPYDAKLLTFQGTYRADINQVCVASLEAFDEKLRGEFERSFRLTRSAPNVPDGQEEADDFPDEGVAFVDLLGDELALCLSAFPRKPDAKMPEFYGGEEIVEEARPNPFAVLEQLKSSKEET